MLHIQTAEKVSTHIVSPSFLSFPPFFHTSEPPKMKQLEKGVFFKFQGQKLVETFAGGTSTVEEIWVIIYIFIVFVFRFSCFNPPPIVLFPPFVSRF